MPSGSTHSSGEFVRRALQTMSSHVRRWKMRYQSSPFDLRIDQLRLPILFGVFLGLLGVSGGCATQPDLLKLQQKLNQEKEQSTQRQEALQRHTDDSREQLQRDQDQLREQLDAQRKEFTKSQVALAEETRQSLDETNTVLHAELSEVRAIAAQIRGDLATVREGELGSVIGKTEENQKGVDDLRLQLDVVSDTFQKAETKRQQSQRKERDQVQSALARHGTALAALQSSLSEVGERSAAQSLVVDDFGEVLGKRIEELEKHRTRIETSTARLIEKQAADVTAVTANLNQQRESFAGFEVALGKLGEQLAVQVDSQGGQQDKRIQALSAQVQRMQGWVETRTQELAEQDAADMAVTTTQLGELRGSLAGFQGAVAKLGDQLSAQLGEQESQGDERVQALSARVQRMQGWVETRTQELAEQQVADVAAAATQLDEFGASLAGFKVAFEQLGERLGTQVNLQGGQEDERIQALSAQVQRMQGWVETRTQELAEQDATDMAMTALRIDELRSSLVDFETALASIGNQLSAQQGEQGNQQDQRLAIIAEQVERMHAAQTAMQGWVETRTQELAEQDATDMAMTALRIDELRSSLVDFETALASIGNQLSAQQGEQGNQQDQRLAIIAEQVERMHAAQTSMQEWAENRTAVIEEKQRTDHTATAAQLEKLRGSLGGFEDAIVRLGEGIGVQMSEHEAERESLAAQMQTAQRAIQVWVEARIAELDENQKQLEEVREAVVKMDARGIATITRVNELTRLIDQLTTPLK